MVSGAPALTSNDTVTSSVSGSPYVITAAAGTLSATNYTFSYTPGTLTITTDGTTTSVSSSGRAPASGSR